MNDGTDAIPQRHQRQDSLDDQLSTLRRAAIKLGCYDADDWLRKIIQARSDFREHFGSEDRYL